MKFCFLNEKPQKRLATLSVVVVVLLVTSLVSCTSTSLSGRAIDGKVVEAATQKPVAGAIVTTLWRGYTPQLDNNQSECFYVGTAVSDKDGNFHLPAWKKYDRLAPFVTLNYVYILSTVLRQSAVKTEYGGSIQGFIPWESAMEAEPVRMFFYPTITLRVSPVAPTREESLKMLVQAMRLNCDHAGTSAKNLYPLFNASYEEAKSLAVTDEDKRIVNMLHRLAEDVLSARDEDPSHVRRSDTE